MRTLLFGIVITFGVCLFQGCISYTCSTVKFERTTLPPSNVRYYVNSLNLSPSAAVYPFGSYQENKANGNKRNQIIRESFARNNPEIFTEQRVNAVPIDVTIDVVRKKSPGTDSLTAFLCGFTYGILPGRLTNNLDVNVTVQLSEGFCVSGSTQAFAYDERSEYTLMFYSPINLIMAPVSTKCNGCRGFGGDTYDWYPNRELSDIVCSALANFNQHQLKEALESRPNVDVKAHRQQLAPKNSISPSTPVVPIQQSVTVDEIPL